MKGYHVLVFATLLLSACAKSVDYPALIKAEAAPDLFVVSNASVFTGRDDALLKGFDIFVRNGIIEKVEAHANITTDGYEVIDATDKYVIPGLIDAHVHLASSGAVPWDPVKEDVGYNLQAYLYMGITTIYELGGFASDARKLKEEMASGKLLGPSLFHTHFPVSVKESHPVPLGGLFIPKLLRPIAKMMLPTIDEPAEAEEIVEDYIKEEVDYMKVVCDELPTNTPSMSEAQLKALVEASHKKGLKVFAHIGSTNNALTAMRAGADIFAHGIMRGELSDAQAEDLVKAGIPVIWTRAGYENVYRIGTGAFQPTDLERRLILPQILEPITGGDGLEMATYPVMKDFVEDTKNQQKFWSQNVRTFYRKGGKVMIGTDSNLPGSWAGATYMQELKLLSQDGISNVDLLRSATYGNAHLFLEAPDFGSIEPGKKADLVILNKNPLENIEAIDHQHSVIKGSQVITRL